MFNWLTNKKMIASLNSTIKATSVRNDELERELRDLKYSATFNEQVAQALSIEITELKNKLPPPPVQIGIITITYDNNHSTELEIFDNAEDKKLYDDIKEWFRTGKTMTFEVILNEDDGNGAMMLQWSKIVYIRFTTFTNNK